MPQIPEAYLQRNILKLELYLLFGGERLREKHDYTYLYNILMCA